MAKVVVVKVGGRVLNSGADGVLDDVSRIAKEGRKVVLVHGGGDVVTRYCEAMGIEPRFLVSPSGIRSRYTSREELEVYLMVMAGLINKRLVAALSKRGVRALGISGIDAAVVTAVRKKRVIAVDERGRKRVVSGGYTGRINSVDRRILEELLERFDVLVLAPVAIGEEFEPLNVDGDQMASRVASAIGAEYLVILSDVDGAIVDGKLLGRVTPAEARSACQRVGAGMNRKLMMAAEAVEGGVGAAIIANGLKQRPIERAIRGEGTVVTMQ